MHKIEIEIDKVRTSETAVATESDGTSEARGRRLESGIRVTEREREKWEYMQGIGERAEERRSERSRGGGEKEREGEREATIVYTHDEESERDER